MKATVIKGGDEIATIETNPFRHTLHQDDDAVSSLLDEMDRLTDWDTDLNPDDDPSTPSETEIEADDSLKFSSAIANLRGQGYRIITTTGAAEDGSDDNPNTSS